MSEIREQFRIIRWKNNLLVKRNKSDLVLDLLYPVIFLCVLISISANLKNVHIPEKLEYPMDNRTNFLQTGLFLNSSRIVLMPAANRDCMNTDLQPFAMAINATLGFMRIYPSIVCIKNETDLTAYGAANKISLAIEFENTSSLTTYSKENVKYFIRLNEDSFALTNYKNYSNIYHQSPSTVYMTGAPMLTVFLPIQNFIDSLITVLKTGKLSLFTVDTNLFPFMSYDEDTRLSALRSIMPIYMVLILCFPLITVASRLLTERETRVQEGLLMAGLNETVWYVSWYTSLLTRCLIVSAVASILTKFFIIQKSSLLILLLVFLVCSFLMAGFCMAITSLFDKSDSGSGVIILLVIFGSLPGMFVMQLPMWAYAIFSVFFPPMAIIELFCIILYADSVSYRGIHWDNFFSTQSSSLGVNLGYIVALSIVGGIFWAFFGYYLNKIVKHRYGKAEKCCFCLNPKHNKSLSKVGDADIDTSYIDNMESEHVEAVDSELKQRNGVRIDKICKTFPPASKGEEPIMAVKDFSASFYEGQISVLLGHNGAGKSTLISVLTGLYGSTDGDAYAYNKSLLHNLKELRSMIGVCPQQNLLIPVLTCREHLILFGRLRKVPMERLSGMVDDILADIDMSDKADAQVKTLSGGMKRRLNVAMALIGDPKIIYLDEPTSGMDPTSRRFVWSLLEKKKKDRVIVLCTHFMDEAEFLGDRIVVMSHGQLQVAGSSLFLKSKFGIGYHLNCAKNNGADDNAIMDAVKAFAPDAYVEESNRATITINIARNHVSVLGDLLESLDAKKEELKLSNSGIAATSLEEVFLNLAAEDELTIQKRLTSSTSTHDIKETSAIEGALKLQTDETMKDGKAETLYNDNTSFPVVDATPSLMPQIKTLLWKKALMSVRQKKELIQQTVVPFILMIIASIFLLLGDKLLKIEIVKSIDFCPEVLLNPNNMTMHLPYIYDSNTKSEVMKIIDNYPMEYNGLPMPVDKSTEIKNQMNHTEVSHFIYDAIEEEEEYISLLQYTGNNTYLLWYNTSYSGVLPTMRSVISSTFINSELGTKSLSISTGYKALPTGTKPQLLQVVFVIVFVIYISEGLSFAPIYGGISVARERISQARLQERLMGVWDVYYWISNLLWDLAIGIIDIIFFVIVASILAASLRQAILPLAVTIFMFILAAAPFCYIIQMPFKTAISAEQGLTNIMMITMLGSVLISSLASLFPNITEVGTIIGYVLYLVPTYAMVDTFNRVATTIPMQSMLPEYMRVSPWSWEYCGKTITYLAGEAIIYFILLIIAERKSWIRTGKVVFSRVKYNPEDEDVKEEIANVEKNEEEYAVTVDHVWKVYPGTTKTPAVEANRDVTFGIRHGDCFGLIGPNGAGKTSVISVLMGTLGINEGSCTVNGIMVPKDINSAYKYLGYCPQFDVLFDFLTAYECLYFYGMVKGIPEGQLNDVIDQCLKCLDLEEHRNKFTKDLSGGNKRRLCVAIAFMGNPKVVVMDEPSTGLDPVSRRKLWNIIKTSSKERSFLLTTHLMEEADALCNRIAIMVNGQIQCIGSGQHLKSKYGEGYTLDFKLEDDPEKMEQLKNTLKNELGEFEMRECHGCHATLVLPASKPLSYVFKLMEQNRSGCKIADYTLSQTTLEQVFLHFAKYQREDTLNPMEAAMANNPQTV